MDFNLLCILILNLKRLFWFSTEYNKNKNNNKQSYYKKNYIWNYNYMKEQKNNIRENCIYNFYDKKRGIKKYVFIIIF
jgi:hypothetical protein